MEGSSLIHGGVTKSTCDLRLSVENVPKNVPKHVPKSGNVPKLVPKPKNVPKKTVHAPEFTIACCNGSASLSVSNWGMSTSNAASTCAPYRHCAVMATDIKQGCLTCNLRRDEVRKEGGEEGREGLTRTFRWLRSRCPGADLTSESAPEPATSGIVTDQPSPAGCGEIRGRR